MCPNKSLINNTQRAPWAWTRARVSALSLLLLHTLNNGPVRANLQASMRMLGIKQHVSILLTFLRGTVKAQCQSHGRHVPAFSPRKHFCRNNMTDDKRTVSPILNTGPRQQLAKQNVQKNYPTGPTRNKCLQKELKNWLNLHKLASGECRRWNGRVRFHTWREPLDVEVHYRQLRAWHVYCSILFICVHRDRIQHFAVRTRNCFTKNTENILV